MEKLFTVLFYILMIGEYATFYYAVFRQDNFRDFKRFGRIRLCLGMIALGAILCIGGLMEWYSGFELIPILCGTLIAMYLIFQMQFSENFRIWFISFFIISILEIAGNSLLKTFSMYDEISQSILYTMGITVMAWLYYALLGKKLKKSDFKIPEKMWKLIVCVLFILVLVMSLLEHLLEKTSNESTFFIGIILLSVSAPVLVILIFSIIYYFNNTKKYYMETEMLEDFNERQKEYFIRLLNREQETKKFRHDIENELLQLRHYFENGNYEQLGEYLSDMMGELKNIHGKNYDVGNDIVNTIINYYFCDIENATILVSGYMEDEMFINQRDLCILVSNIIKNAVEAIEVSENEKQIRFSVEQGRQYICFHVENSFGNTILNKENGFYVTTKKDKNRHGIGLQNVWRIIEKYEGKYLQEIKNHTYILDICLKNVTV